MSELFNEEHQLSAMLKDAFEAAPSLLQVLMESSVNPEAVSPYFTSS